MRKKIVAGNWKMNTTIQEGVLLAKQINEAVAKIENNKISIIIAPPLTHLAEITKSIDYRKISVAAQNCSSEIKGAFTGEVSALMIKSTGASYCIVGHSERRAYHYEDNHLLKTKIEHCIDNALFPIYCCGELLEEREANKHFDVVEAQLKETIFSLPDYLIEKVIIAYEPVWAIGTGKTATSQQAQEMHAFIRKSLEYKYGIETANKICILYGGSCNPKNAKELFANPDIDGGLIGGASLNTDDFIAIINSF